MKKYKIAIFTNEYFVNVVIGTKKEIIEALSEYTTYSSKTIESDLLGKRGIAYNCFPELHPIIAVDDTMSINDSITTLAHEAVHAISYIQDYIGIKDNNYEFLAHGVRAIMSCIFNNMRNMK